MKKVLFTGACTALVTPFLDGQINYPMLERLLRYQIDSGIRSVVICGTTGEAPTLSDSEKLEMFRRAKSFVGNDCLIIAGTGSNSTEHTLHLSCAAQECGVDALLVVSPYYNKANPEGLILHYEAVAQAVDLPIILYNVPSRTGLDIPVTVYQRLSSLANIAGVKEASTNITKLTQIELACGDELPIWTGNDEHIVPAMAMGAAGVISVVSNVMPVETQAMAMAAASGDFLTANALRLEMQPLIEALFSEVSPIPVKAAMALIGFECGPCRLPLGPISIEKSTKLRTLLA